LDKIGIAKQNLVFPTIIFLLSLGTILLVLLTKKITHNKNFYIIFSIILIFIISLDLLRFSTKWMPFDSKVLVYPNIPVASEFSGISGVDRVVSNLGEEATNYYKLPALGGYDAVYIKRYGEFMASLQSGSLQDSARSVVSFPNDGLDTTKALDLLGVKFVIYKVADGRAPWTFPFWNYKDGTFSLIYNDGVYQILQNDKAFQRAFLVNKYFVENDPQKILNTMFNKSFDLQNQIVLEKNPNLKLDIGSRGWVQIMSYDSNQVVLKTNSNGNSMLFLSDSFYPGWEAYVDGKITELYRADFTFRAIYLPKGVHDVKFIYNPLSFRLGIIFAVLGLLLLGLFSMQLGKKVARIKE
jgi:uncharacterized membrane protein YfhO